MALDSATIETHGDELYQAMVERRTLRPLRERVPEITIDDAYLIQSRMVARRVQAGETVIGKKIGVTSRSVQDLLGVFQPDFGQLTSRMRYQDGATVPLDTLIQPRAEGEIAFVLKEDLKGPGITAIDVLRATDHVLACFEIVDSRIAGWDIKICDTVADNASCGVFVLGATPVDPTDVDLTLVGMTIERNGELATTGVGAAVQGSPVNSVTWLANTLGSLGIPFRSGEVILSGSLAGLVPVEPGDELVCRMGGLGSVSVTFK